MYIRARGAVLSFSLRRITYDLTSIYFSLLRVYVRSILLSGRDGACLRPWCSGAKESENAYSVSREKTGLLTPRTLCYGMLAITRAGLADISPGLEIDEVSLFLSSCSPCPAYICTRENTRIREDGKRNISRWHTTRLSSRYGGYICAHASGAYMEIG